MKTILMLISMVFAGAFWYTVGGKEEPVEQYYWLIPQAGGQGPLESRNRKYGKVILEHQPENHFFKAKVLVHPSLASSGFQLFVNGDSNYRMMEYGKQYFWGVKLTDHREIVLRVNIGEGRYQRFQLEKVDGKEAFIPESKLRFTAFISLLL
ncbi:hypothetical protein [Echinicola vietnamensis]|nr:hypothetical protein [Echinicola vietnamensis]